MERSFGGWRFDCNYSELETEKQPGTRKQPGSVKLPGSLKQPTIAKQPANVKPPATTKLLATEMELKSFSMLKKLATSFSVEMMEATMLYGLTRFLWPGKLPNPGKFVFLKKLRLLVTGKALKKWQQPTTQSTQYFFNSSTQPLTLHLTLSPTLTPHL